MHNHQINNILYPIDFSERSINALLSVIHLTKKAEAKLIIYHSYHREAGAGGHSSQHYLNKAKRIADEHFDNLSTRFKSDFEGLDYTFEKELGLVAENISDVINRHSVKLLVLSTTGARGMNRLWGTKTDEIVKLINIPVIIIPGESSIAGLKKIALVCDYSKDVSLENIKLMNEIADYFNCRIDVLNIDTEEREKNKDEVEVAMKVHEMLNNVPHKFKVSFDHTVEDGILKYARTHEVGLITLLPKSYTLIEELFHESVTKKLTYRSDIPLLFQFLPDIFFL
jgi:nucleotide-binding universal stress UspA family protein